MTARFSSWTVGSRGSGSQNQPSRRPNRWPGFATRFVNACLSVRIDDEHWPGSKSVAAPPRLGTLPSQCLRECHLSDDTSLIRRAADPFGVVAVEEPNADVGRPRAIRSVAARGRDRDGIASRKDLGVLRTCGLEIVNGPTVPEHRVEL